MTAAVWPSRRRERAPRLGHTRANAGIAATAVGLHAVVNGPIPEAVRVPAGLAAAGVVARLAASSGVSMRDLGLDRRQARASLGLGLLAATPIVIAMTVGPRTSARRAYRDWASTTVTPVRAAYEVLIRIPLGTALPEEVIFRGALLAIFSRGRSPLAGAVMSSALFGLWHVVPTLNRLHTNPALRRRPPAQKAAWSAVAVASTAAAGLTLSWLRLRSDSLLAPWLAHTAANSTGFVVGWLAPRRAYRGTADVDVVSAPADNLPHP